MEGNSKGVEGMTSDHATDVNSEVFKVALLAVQKIMENCEFDAYSSGVFSDFLRSEDAPEFFDFLLSSIAPKGIDPALWMRWLRGGETPQIKNPWAIRSANPSSRKVRKTEFIETATNRSKRQRDLVARLIAKRAEMDREIEQEQQKLQLFMNAERAAFMAVLGNEVARLMSARIAVGPLFTIARAISATVPESHVSERVKVSIDPDREKVRAALSIGRAETTDFILQELDFFCGYPFAEDQLRSAILDCLQRLRDDREEAEKMGRKARSKPWFSVSARPEVLNDASDVLNGLKPSKRVG